MIFSWTTKDKQHWTFVRFVNKQSENNQSILNQIFQVKEKKKKKLKTGTSNEKFSLLKHFLGTEFVSQCNSLQWPTEHFRADFEMLEVCLKSCYKMGLEHQMLLAGCSSVEITSLPIYRQQPNIPHLHRIGYRKLETLVSIYLVCFSKCFNIHSFIQPKAL